MRMTVDVPHRSALSWLWLSGVVILLDQVSKWLAVTQLRPFQEHPVLPSFNISLVYNNGAAWSLFSDASGWQRWFFTVVSAAVSAMIVLWMRKLARTEQWTCVALALILGGALGNLIDRLRIGQVIDFIHLYYDRFHWPVFNIADSAITIGAVILALSSLRMHKAATG